MKASRFIFSEISQKFPIMPFSARFLGFFFATVIIELGDYVAHIKFTVLLMPNGSDRITSHPLQELQATKSIDDPEIKAWLALGIKTKKKGGGKKKKGKKGDKTEDAAGAEAEPMEETAEATSQA
ncbi:unnamed protein product [Linum tenue]|uniref:Uncharacterized protein n=1 Tax=Linum tenue TaxID=586396 RepID=A0AAV0Q5V9_9ROSI|nr:unnamed protein product [Linum tenue]